MGANAPLSHGLPKMRTRPPLDLAAALRYNISWTVHPLGARHLPGTPLGGGRLSTTTDASFSFHRGLGAESGPSYFNVQRLSPTLYRNIDVCLDTVETQRGARRRTGVPPPLERPVNGCWSKSRRWLLLPEQRSNHCPCWSRSLILELHSHQCPYFY